MTLDLISRVLRQPLAAVDQRTLACTHGVVWPACIRSPSADGWKDHPFLRLYFRGHGHYSCEMIGIVCCVGAFLTSLSVSSQAPEPISQILAAPIRICASHEMPSIARTHSRSTVLPSRSFQSRPMHGEATSAPAGATQSPPREMARSSMNETKASMPGGGGGNRVHCGSAERDVGLPHEEGARHHWRAPVPARART